MSIRVYPYRFVVLGVFMLIYLVVSFPASYIIDTYGIKKGLWIGQVTGLVFVAGMSMKENPKTRKPENLKTRKPENPNKNENIQTRTIFRRIRVHRKTPSG